MKGNERQCKKKTSAKKTASKTAIKEAIKTLFEENPINVNTARTIVGKKAFIEFESVEKARDLATKIGML